MQKPTTALRAAIDRTNALLFVSSSGVMGVEEARSEARAIRRVLVVEYRYLNSNNDDIKNSEVANLLLKAVVRMAAACTGYAVIDSDSNDELGRNLRWRYFNFIEHNLNRSLDCLRHILLLIDNDDPGPGSGENPDRTGIIAKIDTVLGEISKLRRFKDNRNSFCFLPRSLLKPRKTDIDKIDIVYMYLVKSMSHSTPVRVRNHDQMPEVRFARQYNRFTLTITASARIDNYKVRHWVPMTAACWRGWRTLAMDSLAHRVYRLIVVDEHLLAMYHSEKGAHSTSREYDRCEKATGDAWHWYRHGAGRISRVCTQDKHETRRSLITQKENNNVY